jgi:hypothetical protein
MSISIEHLPFWLHAPVFEKKRCAKATRNMKNIDLTSVKLAILVANGFEQEQVTAPIEFLRRAGATPIIVSPEKEKVTETSEKPVVVVDNSLVTTLGTDSIVSFNEAFAQICSQHKKSTGGSLHTD